MEVAVNQASYLDPTTLASLIALGGVFLSIIASILVARNTLKVEGKKLDFQLHQMYSQELLKKRIEIYPKIYECLSSFVKLIAEKRTTRKEIDLFFNKFNQLDSSCAIYFGPKTIVECWDFREKLYELKYFDDNELEKYLSSKKKVKELQDSIGNFELALKSEIGVYGLEKINLDDVPKPRFEEAYPKPKLMTTMSNAHLLEVGKSKKRTLVSHNGK